MKTWRVQSGDLDRIVTAMSVEAAARKALRKESKSGDPGKLGTLMDVIEVVADAEPYYVSTETVCRDIGAWRERSEA